MKKTLFILLTGAVFGIIIFISFSLKISGTIEKIDCPNKESVCVVNIKTKDGKMYSVFYEGNYKYCSNTKGTVFRGIYPENMKIKDTVQIFAKK